MLQESAQFFGTVKWVGEIQGRKIHLLGTLKFKDTNLDQEMTWPQVARCWGEFPGKLWDIFAPAVPVSEGLV